ncbi:alpha-(1,3)-fucosyltransferase 7 isoform X2 [Lepisosteus oculatus]
MPAPRPSRDQSWIPRRKAQKLLLLCPLAMGLLLCSSFVLQILTAAVWARSRGPGTPARNLTVLLWHWPFGKPYSLEGDVCGAAYGVPGCTLTDNRSLYQAADVVVFHHQELRLGTARLPTDRPRPAGQKWVWLSLESPAVNQNLSRLNGLFNWTMSYRRDADIFMPYGRVLPLEEGEEGEEEGGTPFPVPSKHPRVLATWVVSNYRERHERTRVYKQLSRLMAVDVYGRYGRRPLSPEGLLPTISRYRFYLAFENSVYRDYITEKLWRNSFQAGSVPVVLGPPRADYEAQAPPGSFIHVDDFNSTGELAAFLRGLAADEGRYRGFFAWRRRGRVHLYTDWRERLCAICARHPQLPPGKVYHDLDAWARW